MPRALRTEFPFGGTKISWRSVDSRFVCHQIMLIFRCKKDEASVQAADRMLKEAQATFAKLNEKNEKAERIYRKEGNKDYIGGYKKWSPQGVVSITPKEWREWKEFLTEKNNNDFKPLFGAIHKAKKTD